MWYTLIPLGFVLTMAIYGLVIQIGRFYDQSNWLLVVMGLVVLAAAIMVLLEAVATLARQLRANRETEAAPAEGQ
ncbi:hypothetical protein [Alkalilimnicola ehrlichii]|uniref:hypothetical protein n=1 Tax=Alkalilimnicola ehrlichii TaxID=351052 RepID=UPI002161BFFB|nr:hypothetical protein [Alkalilimnicola ehrlichii]